MNISKLFYHTTLKSLKNTLHKFDKQELMNDISLARDFYDEALETLDFPYDYRIKSMESCRIKYIDIIQITPLKEPSMTFSVPGLS